LENEITEATVVNRAELMKGLAAVADAMTSRIMSANVDRSVKEDLLNDLAGVSLTLKEVADKQTRLRRSGNGTDSKPILPRLLAEPADDADSFLPSGQTHEIVPRPP
jgi:hypothetical protein